MLASEVRIKAVEGKKDVMKFIKFPWHIYGDDPYWVPPLIRERKSFFDPHKNPFFKHAEVALFLAQRGDQTVGTIAAIIDDNYNAFQEERAGFFGCFEVIEDYAVAEKLLATARDWVQDRGMEIIRGPTNFSTNSEYALLVEGFDSSPVVMMTYNPPYYVDFIEGFGFRKARDLYAYISDWSVYGGSVEGLPKKVFRVAEAVRRKQGVRIRKARLREDFEGEVAIAKKIYNSAWSKLWGFVPMTEEEFDYLAHGLKPFLKEDFVLIAEVEGKAVGFSLTLPDVNQILLHIKDGRLFPLGWLKFLWYSRKMDTARVIVMGVIEEYRGRGLDALFYLETARAVLRKGYERAELSLILEDNEMMNKILQRLGGRVYKTYRIYEMDL